jgi:hypothetical protein
MDKKYKLHELPSTVPQQAVKPEFRYALPDTENKVVEHSFSSATASNVRTLQSEIFESQGHFNASRSCSPFPVYVPKSRSETPLTDTEGTKLPKKVILLREVEEEPKNPKHEEQMRKITLLGNKEKSEVIKSQKSCFTELQGIQTAYDEADKKLVEFTQSVQGGIKQDESEVTKILQNMKKAREGETLIISQKDESLSKCNNFTEERVKEEQRETFVATNEDISSRQISNENVNDVRDVDIQNTVQCKNICLSKTTTQVETKEEEQENSQKRKKPPETIIGARPIFGQANINNELQKALSGRQKSIQGKRSREVTKQIDKTSGLEPKFKLEKTEKVFEEKSSDQSKLSTQFLNNEVAQVETIRPSKNEEVEKVFYQQEREYHVDYQTVQEEIVYPKDNETNYYTSKCFVSNNSDNKFNSQVMEAKSNLSQSSVEISQNGEVTLLSQEEDYQKIPVKSLIKNFEQSSMPVFRYKQIREPSPTVVEKLSSKYIEHSDSSHNISEQKLSTNQEEILQVAEQEFDNLYYIANAKVETQYYPLEQITNLQQSENSSFCKYTSQKSQFQSSSAFREENIVHINENGEEGKQASVP